MSFVLPNSRTGFKNRDEIDLMGVRDDYILMGIFSFRLHQKIARFYYCSYFINE